MARGGRLVAGRAVVIATMRLEQNDGSGRRRGCCCDLDKETDRFETVGVVGVYRCYLRQMLGAWVVGRPMGFPWCDGTGSSWNCGRDPAQNFRLGLCWGRDLL